MKRLTPACWLQHLETVGIFSAASKELVNIIEDQVQDQSAAVLVWNKESTFWKDMNMKSTVAACAAEMH